MTVYSKKTKKGTRWYFQFIKEGVYHRGGGFPTMREAKDAEARERNLLFPRPKMAFGEVCDKYLTWIRDRNQSERWIYEKTLFIKKLKEWYLIPIDEITPQMVETFIIQRGKEISGYMGNKALKFLKAIMNYAISQNWLEFNPCEGIKPLPVEEKEKAIPTLRDFLKVCQVANPKERALLILIFCTLGRIGEVLGIRKKDDVFENHLILRSRKHRDGSLKERKIPMGITLKEVIASLLERSGNSEYLISNPREKGNRYLRRPKLMRYLCKKAGVKFFGFHSIRHLATSVLMAKGATLKTLQDLLGHAKIGTTSIYVHSIGDSLQMAAEELGKIFEEGK